MQSRRDFLARLEKEKSDFFATSDQQLLDKLLLDRHRAHTAREGEDPTPHRYDAYGVTRWYHGRNLASRVQPASVGRELWREKESGSQRYADRGRHREKHFHPLRTALFRTVAKDSDPPSTSTELVESAILFTTLEPCNSYSRSNDNSSCSQQIVHSGIRLCCAALWIPCRVSPQAISRWSAGGIVRRGAAPKTVRTKSYETRREEELQNVFDHEMSPQQKFGPR